MDSDIPVTAKCLICDRMFPCGLLKNSSNYIELNIDRHSGCLYMGRVCDYCIDQYNLRIPNNVPKWVLVKATLIIHQGYISILPMT